MHLFLSLLLVIGCAVLTVSAGKLCKKIDELPSHLIRERTRRSEKGRKIGAEFKFSCVSPYELEGSTKIKCVQKGGKAVWNSKLPTCTCPRPCYLPVVKEFVQASITGKICKGENVTYSCKDGAAVLQGDIVRICKKDGTLSGQSLECDRGCGEPSPPNTIISWEIKTLCARNNDLYGDGSEVELVCKDGYKALNLKERPFRLTCHGAEGSWRGIRPDCHRGCTRPLDPENGRIIEVKDRYEVGECIRYECQPGFVLHNRPIRDCLPDGTWCGPDPCCHRVSCPRDFFLENGRIEYVFEKVKFSCFDGYDMIGADELVCMPNKRWNGKAPKCVRNCGGCQVFKTLTLPSSRSCARGIGGQISDFSVDGRRLQTLKDCSVTCLQTMSKGEFVFGAKNPRLWIDMRREYDVSSVTVYGVKEIGKNMIKTFKLNDLKNLPESGEITSIEGFEVHVSQNWNYPIASEDDKQRSKATRCGHRKDTVSNNSTDYDVCCDNYIPGRYLSIHVPGNNRILSICEVDIYVKPYDKVCHHKDKYPKHASVTGCPDPGFIRNGRRTPKDGKDEFKVGEYVVYTCNECFKLHGDHVMKCGADGKWNGSVPQCLKKPCNETANKSYCVYEDFEHGIVRSKTLRKVTIGEKVTFVCDDDYVLEGKECLTCVGGCVWSDHWPQCKLKACDKPLDPPNGKFCPDYQIYKVNTSVTLKCNVGYEVKGLKTVRCNDSLQWHDPLPTCVVVTCPKPNVSENVLVSPDRDYYRYPSKVKFFCKDDTFELIGNDESECNEKGKWTKQPPICESLCKNTSCDFSNHKKLILNKNEQCECVCTDESDCSEIDDPVCGSDAVTYKTECHLHSEVCKTKKSISKVADGPCKQGGVCSAPKPSGDCPAYEYKWYYNSDKRICERFLVGGCFKGLNVFETQHECYKTCECNTFCKEPVDIGPCRNNVPKYHFDWADNSCKPLYYKGCFGNNNNFASQRSCEKICRSQKRYGIVSSAPCQKRHCHLTVKEACKKRSNLEHFMVTLTVDLPPMFRFGSNGFVVTVGKKYWGPRGVVENNQVFLVNAETIRCPCSALLQRGEYLITGTLPAGSRWPQFTEHDLILPFANYRKLEEKVRNECPELY